MTEKKQKIVVALSGGVDSAVAAALLKEQGYEVVAAFMKNWSDTKTVTGECAWKDEYRDAARVAVILEIPITLFDFEREYREQVAEYMFREYEAGRTPNPDVLCNSEVKFPLFWREAKKLGADLIATGHHVRKSQIANRISSLRGSKADEAISLDRHASLAMTEERWQLLVGKDSNKDQSYFLHRLSQDDLEHTLFPIGEFTKSEVRQMARERGLPVADKRSTRGICFVGKMNMPEFLSQAVQSVPGQVRTTHGEVIGEHRGFAPYTIGQRHGFGIGGGTPYYIVAKEPETNTLIVGDENDLALYKNEIKVRDIHWISGQTPKLPLQCQARIRYRSQLVNCHCERSEAISSKEITTSFTSFTPRDDISVRFVSPIRAPAPGQFAVFYDGDECLGGGIIV